MMVIDDPIRLSDDDDKDEREVQGGDATGSKKGNSAWQRWLSH